MGYTPYRASPPRPQRYSPLTSLCSGGDSKFLAPLLDFLVTFLEVSLSFLGLVNPFTNLLGAVVGVLRAFERVVPVFGRVQPVSGFHFGNGFRAGSKGCRCTFAHFHCTSGEVLRGLNPFMKTSVDQLRALS